MRWAATHLGSALGGALAPCAVWGRARVGGPWGGPSVGPLCADTGRRLPECDNMTEKDVPVEPRVLVFAKTKGGKKVFVRSVASTDYFERADVALRVLFCGGEEGEGVVASDECSAPSDDDKAANDATRCTAI